MVACIFVLEYIIAVTCLSSYNSPAKFPIELLLDIPSFTEYGVYPNPAHYYYFIPWFFKATHQTVETSGYGIQPVVQVKVLEFFSIDVSARRLNGVWIDYCTSVMVIIYFNTCNFWMLFRNVKVISSDETEKNLRAMKEINDLTDEKKLSINELRKGI
jgi:hypothetical protein